MKTIVRAIAVAAAFAAVGSTASAQTLLNNANVDVKVTLTSQCRWQSGSAPTGLTVDFGGYTAFGGAVTGSTTSLVLECTRSFGLSPTVTWDAVGTTAAADGKGVVAGLYYQLSLTGANTSAGAAPTVAGGAASGTPRVVTYTLGGSMPAGQAGTDAANAEVTQTRTLLLQF